MNGTPDQSQNNELRRPWVLVTGALFGAFTLIFLMYLIVSGKTVACGSRFQLALIVSLGTALSGAFLGGNAAASGTFGPKDSAIKFSALGGIGTLVIMLGLTYQFYLSTPCYVSPFGKCPDVTGAWRRFNDLQTFNLKSDGCKVTGVDTAPPFESILEGEFISDEAESRATVKIRRIDHSQNDCEVVMQGTLWPWPYGDRLTGLRMKIFANDGRCPKSIDYRYNEDYFYDKQ